MKVLFLMFTFPNMDTSFNMYTTIVKEFVKNGHEVFIVAPDVKGLPTGINSESGIDVLRVKTLPVKNVSNYIKGISNVLLPLQFGKALKKFYPDVKFDLVISPTPPITLVDLALKIKAKHNAKFYLVLRDIFPQNAVDLGFMKEGGMLHKYFKAKEEKLYNNADYIGCMSPGNSNYLLKHHVGLKSEKLHELKNFQILYQEEENYYDSLRDKYDLKGKFVILFGGNMGKPQQLENVIELAKSCQVTHPDVLFFLLGEGVHMKKLAEIIKNENIVNIKIVSTIPKQEYQKLLSVCDVGLISLHKDFTIPNIPSKTLDYFNVGLPVLASIDEATDYGDVLDEANAGFWSIAGDHKSFKANFEKLYNDDQLRKEMGKNGRAYFEKYLTPAIAYKTIINAVKPNHES